MDQRVQEAINTHRQENIHIHNSHVPLPWRGQHGAGVRGAEAAGAAQGRDDRLSISDDMSDGSDTHRSICVQSSSSMLFVRAGGG